MPKLYECTDDRLLGEVSQTDIDLLVAQLEETSSTDRDYCIDNDTFLRLADAGASSTLLDAVKSGLDLSGGEVEIRWQAD